MEVERARLEIETLVKTCLKLDGKPRKRASGENLKLLGDLCKEHPDIAKEFNIEIPDKPKPNSIPKPEPEPEPEPEEPVFTSFQEAWLKGPREIRLLTMQDGSLRQKLNPEEKKRARAIVKKYGGV